jgi:hypothetical protein
MPTELSRLLHEEARCKYSNITRKLQQTRDERKPEETPNRKMMKLTGESSKCRKWMQETCPMYGPFCNACGRNNRREENEIKGWRQ